MNKQKLKAVMTEHGDTQESLAKAMGLSLSRFNAKLNERNGAAFNQIEITFIVSRYNLDAESAMQIFFAEKVA